MGFILTLVYVALSLLSPKDLLPSLADFRVELIIALLAVLFSLPGMLDGRFLRIPQNYLLVGLFAAVFLSIAIANHWLGGGFLALQRFLPSAVVFYLVVLNCQSFSRLRWVVRVLTAVGFFYVIAGARSYLAGDINSKLLEVIPVSGGTYTFRMEGLGFLHDPNELAQLLVTILPFLWARWQRGLHLSNFLRVIAPTLFFVWGIYMTHSRGAILAVVVILIVALHDRIRLVPAILAGAIALSIMLSLDFSAGREISVESGAHRFQMWSNGLDLFKESPLFGIGFQGFAHQNSGLTAHNSFVVCLAELGIFGYVFWIALLAFTLAGLNSLIRSAKARAAASTLDGNEKEVGAQEEIYKWARAVRVSLAGFLAAAFFLSRAYSMTLYLVLGIGVVVLCLSSGKDESVDRQSMPRLFAFSAAVGVAAIALVYASLRLRSFLS